jgi:hypothetical protein
VEILLDGTTDASNPMKRDLKLLILVNDFCVFFRVLLKVFLEVGLLVIPSAQISPDNKGIKSPENI